MTDFAFFTFSEDCGLLPISFANADFMWDALFLWKMFIFVPLSIQRKASCMFLAVGFFFAFLRILVIPARIFLLVDSLFLSALSFFLALFITGIALF